MCGVIVYKRLWGEMVGFGSGNKADKARAHMMLFVRREKITVPPGFRECHLSPRAGDVGRCHSLPLGLGLPRGSYSVDEICFWMAVCSVLHCRAVSLFFCNLYC